MLKSASVLISKRGDRKINAANNMNRDRLLFVRIFQIAEILLQDKTGDVTEEVIAEQVDIAVAAFATARKTEIKVNREQLIIRLQNIYDKSLR